MQYNSVRIVALLVSQQYEKGISGNGMPLAPYSTAYAKRKSAMAINQGHTDFSLTGLMQSKMELTVVDGEYLINSPVQVGNYSLSSVLNERDPGSFDLTDDNKIAVYEIIAPELGDGLRELI